MDLERDESSRESSRGDSNHHGNDHGNDDMSGDGTVDDGLIERNGSCAHHHDGDDGLVLNSDENTVKNSLPIGFSGDHQVGFLGLNSDDNHVNTGKEADFSSHEKSNHLGSGGRVDSSLSTARKEADSASSPATVSPPGIPAGSPSRASTSRVGLRKWRRIKREPLKDGTPSSSSDKNLKRGLHGSVNEPSTPLAPVMIREESRGSASSVNAIINETGGIVGLPGLGLGSGYKLELENSTFSAGTDSDNSENRSSKSSTAASAPKFRSKHQSGRNAGSSGQKMHLGKGLVYTDEKPRGGSVGMEIASTLSVPESDSRSSDSVNSNARQRRRPGNHESEQGADNMASGVEEHFATLSESVGEADDISSGDAQLPWLAKRRNRQSDRSWDPLVDSVVMLQSAQDALEREIGKFGEIGKDLNFLGEEWSNATDLQMQLEEVRSILTEKEMKISALEATTYTEHTDLGGVTVELQRAEAINTELEDLIKQRIEAEIEHLIITKATQSSIIQVKNQIKILDEQRTLSEEQEQTAKTVCDAERKAAKLKSQVEELETDCYQDLLGAEEVFNLQKRVMKTTACFLMQLVLLVLVFGLFFLKLSLDSPEVIPT